MPPGLTHSKPALVWQDESEPRVSVRHGWTDDESNERPVRNHRALFVFALRANPVILDTSSPT